MDGIITPVKSDRIRDTLGFQSHTGQRYRLQIHPDRLPQNHPPQGSGAPHPERIRAEYFLACAVCVY